ncbi:MAG: phenylalanine--tRNA ligase subunit beta [Aquificaceae bacterium]|nr:phenylalanine--tRNA ligase subunit beta [Aquificaceae bacterium]
MKIPFSWLFDFLNAEWLDPYRVAEELTLRSVETNVSKWELDIEGVVFAKVVEKKPLKHMSVYKVWAGSETYLQVVSADNSLKEGDGVLLATVGARVGEILVGEKDFDGVRSQGMPLSTKELGLEDQSSGVLLIREDIPPGTSAKELLGSGEFILEIEPTPNRGDLLSVKGLARELSAILNLEKKARQVPEYKEVGSIEIRVESADCKRYRGAVIEGLSVGPSPLWLRKRLWQCGIKTINNVVDITNYVMLLEGQPLHAFDLDSLSLPLFVRDAREGEKIETLLGTEKELKSLNLLIADREKPLAIAGVVGGLKSSVHGATKSILLESAYFDPYRVRKSAKSVSIQTDSSYRFERGVDIQGVKRAQNIAISLILELAGGRLTSLRDVYPEPYIPKKVFLSVEKFRKYSGMDFDRAFVSKTLTALEIDHELHRCGVEVSIPSHRSFDMQRDVDIIEELLRVKGYGALDPMPLRVFSKPSEIESIEESLRNYMSGRGFSEVITFSFDTPEIYQQLSINLPELQIINPLNKFQRFLRTTLIPSLLMVCLENIRNYNYRMAIFELGKTFNQTEETKLAFLMTGRKSLFPEEEYSVYHALSVVRDILNSQSDSYISERSNIGFLHPYLQRAFSVEGERVAFVGVLNPEIQDSLGIRTKVVLGEVSVEKLKRLRRVYKPLAYFPPAVRDLTLLVDKEIDVDKLILHIRSKELMEDVRVFSVYTDSKLGEGKKSVSFRLTLRSREETLSDQRVNQLVDELLKELENKFGARLR